ncbi:MAG: helix-turn-helix transcriptional regulator [Proteobacteria bacterium]|nr:helix-turn-helix transcriptional regulator [Pseudomonadota bacterium]
MTTTDRMRTIAAIAATPPAALALRWSDGTEAVLDLRATLRDRRFRSLRDPAAFARAQLGDWGHSVTWLSGEELSAEHLWLATLTATGRDDTRRFLEWRLRHGLSLSAAADALGLSRRMVAYYSNGEKRVPRPILLACTGWEVGQAA